MIRQRLREHLANPVLFAQEVGAMYEAGARVFVEVGPGSVLTNLADQILEGRPHVALATDVNGRNGIVQLLQAVGRLAVHGVPVSLERLFAGRELTKVDLEHLDAFDARAAVTSTTWMVNGAHARPASDSLPTRAAPMEWPNSSAYAPARAAVSETSLASGSFSGSVVVDDPAVTASFHTEALHAPMLDGAAGGDVMVAFQQLMERFVDVQQEVMLGYLGRGSDLATGTLGGELEPSLH